MTIPASAVPAARLALFAKLQDALGEQNLLVSLDVPMSRTLPDDLVTIGDVVNEVAFLAFMGDLGAGSRQESFTIDVACESYRGGDDAVSTFAAASANADAVMVAVRTDPTLNGTADIEAVPIGVTFESTFSTDKAGTPNGRITTATVTIRVQSSL